MKVKRLRESAVIPKYAKQHDSGFDLLAADDVIIQPGETKLIPTGLAFEIPEGYEIQVRPKSGITLKTKLRVQLGTVDCGYRAEIGVIVDNIASNQNGTEPYGYGPDGKKIVPFHTYGFPRQTYIIQKGDKIGQGVLAPVVHTTFEEADELATSERGMGGFGSTGIRGEQ